MQDFAAIDFEGYGMNIRRINFTACLPHHVNALTPQVISFICRQLPAASTWRITTRLSLMRKLVRR